VRGRRRQGRPSRGDDDRGDDDRGVGMISTAAGFLVFVMFLMLATQVLYGLYARSTVRATLNDAASRAANGVAGDDELLRLADEAEQSLGRMGDRTTITLRLVDDDGDATPDVVEGVAVADPPQFVPASLGGAGGLGEITASVRVRIERFR
jgi:Flp pilus assembly protein TadG